MKLNRLATIDRIDELIAAEEKRHDAKYDWEVLKYEEAVRLWKEETKPNLQVLLTEALAQVKKGIFPDTVLYSGNNRYSDRHERAGKAWGFIPEKPSPKTPFVPSAHYVALKSILTKITNDEEISTSALQDVGISLKLLMG